MEYLPGSLEIRANPSELAAWPQLEEILRESKGYCGYKIPSVGVSATVQIPSFIIVLPEQCIILIDIVSDKITHIDDTDFWSTTEEPIYSRDLVLYNFRKEIENRIKTSKQFFDRKQDRPAIPIKTILAFASNTREEIESISGDAGGLLSEIHTQTSIWNELGNTLRNLPKLNFENADELIALLEGTQSFQGKTPTSKPKALATYSDFIQKSLDHTFKLDQVQRRVSLQLPPGPQRIRGLAGTGKTVILSLKAALTHKDSPDLSILYVFNTKSMYGHIRNLISQYYIAETRQQPDFQRRLRVLHAWGGKSEEGLYSLACKQSGIRPLTFDEVRGATDAYDAIFSDFLKRANGTIQPVFDLVLIDEAQDFPPSFFETIFHLTRDPKRIVWAYDEFQSLQELKIREPAELFGTRQDRTPNIANESLKGTYAGGIDKDFILGNSYRNPRIVISVAHAFALGLYRTGGIIDIIGERRAWDALGYTVKSPKKKMTFSEGDQMVIERPFETSRNILESILPDSIDDRQLVNSLPCANREQEVAQIAAQIETLVKLHGIAPHSIFVVSLATGEADRLFKLLRSDLSSRGISAITPGFVESASTFRVNDCVTLTTPFRAKGNEADVVFIIGADRAISDASFRSRNALFVSITRSRGWVYLAHSGRYSAEFGAELERIITDYPSFRFPYPSEEEVERRRVILRKSDNEIERDERLIREAAESNPELLIEILKSNPDLLNRLK